MEYTSDVYNRVLDFSVLSYSKIKEHINYLKDNYLKFNLEISELTEVAEILKNDHRKNVQTLSQKLFHFIEETNKEIIRVKSMYDFDKQYIQAGFISGVDEVGRGPLAGPIVAASVILDVDYLHNRDLILGIKDSKKLSAKAREYLSNIIKSSAVSYSISELDNDSIDNSGISWCNNEVFKLAVNKLEVKPSLILSDGYAIKNINIRNEFVIKGDEKSASIACASIIAKVYRDNLMKQYAEMYPQYGFDENAGYGTEYHIEALKKYGPCKIHRMCFLKNIL